MGYAKAKCHGCGKAFSRLEEGILFYCPACERELDRQGNARMIRIPRRKKVTVAELKEKLEELAEDLEVVVDGVGLKYISIEINDRGEQYVELS